MISRGRQRFSMTWSNWMCLYWGHQFIRHGCGTGTGEESIVWADCVVCTRCNERFRITE